MVWVYMGMEPSFPPPPIVDLKLNCSLNDANDEYDYFCYKKEVWETASGQKVERFPRAFLVSTSEGKVSGVNGPSFENCRII